MNTKPFSSSTLFWLCCLSTWNFLMSLWTGCLKCILEKCQFYKYWAHRRGRGKRHTRYMQEQKEKRRSESFSCRKRSVPPFIHSLAHTGVSQVTAAVTHAVMQYTKAAPCFERDCNLCWNRVLLCRSQPPAQLTFPSVLGSSWKLGFIGTNSR